MIMLNSFNFIKISRHFLTYNDCDLLDFFLFKLKIIILGNFNKI